MSKLSNGYYFVRCKGSTHNMMGGTACFAGTRARVQTLLDYLEAGDSINDFLQGFPTVKREQVIDSWKRPRSKWSPQPAEMKVLLHECRTP